MCNIWIINLEKRKESKMATHVHLTRKNKFLLIIVFSITICYMFLYNENSSHSLRILKTCKLEKLDPWDKSLKPYLTPVQPLICSHRKPLMYVDRTGNIHLNNSLLQAYSLSTLKCVYQIVVRVDGDSEVIFKPEVQFDLPSFVPGLVFRVKCRDSEQGKLVYDYIHVNPMYTESIKRQNEISPENEDNLSVIILGIDSMSRSHAIRSLNKSYTYLKEEFDMYDFEGYSKVGENTWPNLMPFLTGRSHRDFWAINNLKIYTDSLPLLWFERAISKYATLFAEDRPDIGTFNLGRSGFKSQPTDFYFRPCILAMQSFEPVIVEPLGRKNGVCSGSNSYFEHQLTYLQGFLNKYEQKQKFAFFWNNQAGHEYFLSLSKEDNTLYRFLLWMKQTQQVKNAVFVVMSDHGFRVGGASLTHTGRAENNRPLLLLHVPKHIKQKHPWIHASLTLNTQRLVSHYDMYQTILDIFHKRSFRKSPDRATPTQSYLVKRNIFQEIPEDRTCLDAGIEDQYCACSEKQNISTEDNIVRTIALHIVNDVNLILSKHQALCERLIFDRVSEATVSSSISDELNLTPEQKSEEEKKSAWEKFTDFVTNFVFGPGFVNAPTRRYVVLLYTKPGNAYFQGTVDCEEIKEAPNDIKHKLTMVGEPSRLDRYGNQSHCVNDGLIKAYCYCKHML